MGITCTLSEGRKQRAHAPASSVCRTSFIIRRPPLPSTNPSRNWLRSRIVLEEIQLLPPGQPFTLGGLKRSWPSSRLTRGRSRLAFSEETAKVLGVTERTVYRMWRYARAWLSREVER